VSAAGPPGPRGPQHARQHPVAFRLRQRRPAVPSSVHHPALGTSVQLRCPDVGVVPIGGNVDTRLAKLERGEVDALLLALAGMKRLGREREATQALPPETWLGAVAQGALGLETRRDEVERLRFLNHEESALEVEAERAFLRRLEGGCQVPVGARAAADRNGVTLAGMVAEASGGRLFRGEISGARAEAASLGVELAERLLDQGAGAVLAEARP